MSRSTEKKVESKVEVANAAKELYLLNSVNTGHIEFHGPTMHPFLQDGDRLVVTPVEWRDIHVGDIVTYRLEDKFPTYRVLRKTKSSLSLKADNWPGFYVEIAKEDVIGKVVQRKRGDCVLSIDEWDWRFHSWLAIARVRFVEVRATVRRIKRKIVARVAAKLHRH